MTRGQYRKEGLKYYRAKNYERTAKYFWNSLRLPHHSFTDKLFDANDLAITWIKMEKYNKAIDLLQDHLQQFEHDYYNSKKIGPTYYNLGLAFELLNKPKKAYKNYKLSCKYNPTDACRTKIKALKKNSLIISLVLSIKVSFYIYLIPF